MEQVVRLAEELLPIGNRDVITDVAAAAEAARAAATTARADVEVDLAAGGDPTAWVPLPAVLCSVDDLVLRAEVTSEVRAGLAH